MELADMYRQDLEKQLKLEAEYEDSITTKDMNLQNSVPGGRNKDMSDPVSNIGMWHDDEDDSDSSFSSDDEDSNMDHTNILKVPMPDSNMSMFNFDNSDKGIYEARNLEKQMKMEAEMARKSLTMKLENKNSNGDIILYPIEELIQMQRLEKEKAKEEKNPKESTTEKRSLYMEMVAHQEKLQRGIFESEDFRSNYEQNPFIIGEDIIVQQQMQIKLQQDIDKKIDAEMGKSLTNKISNRDIILYPIQELIEMQKLELEKEKKIQSFAAKDIAQWQMQEKSEQDIDELNEKQTSKHSEIRKNTYDPDIIINPDTNNFYKRGQLLGMGKYGSCYKLTDVSTSKVYAAKIISPSEVEKHYGSAIETIDQEIAIQMDLIHPNLFTLHSTFKYEDNVYILVEFGEQISLEELLKRKEVFQDIDARYFLRQILNGVKYLHDKEIFHGELNLSHLFVNKEMELKIFNIEFYTVVMKGEVLRDSRGSPNYMAPEIVNEFAYGLEADIWSVGCSLYTMLVGKPPFDAERELDIRTNIRAHFYQIPDNLQGDAKCLINLMLHPKYYDRLTAKECLQFNFLTDPKYNLPDKIPICAVIVEEYCGLSSTMILVRELLSEQPEQSEEPKQVEQPEQSKESKQAEPLKYDPVYSLTGLQDDKTPVNPRKRKLDKECIRLLKYEYEERMREAESDESEIEENTQQCEEGTHEESTLQSTYLQSLNECRINHGLEL